MKKYILLLLLFLAFQGSAQTTIANNLKIVTTPNLVTGNTKTLVRNATTGLVEEQTLGTPATPTLQSVVLTGDTSTNIAHFDAGTDVTWANGSAEFGSEFMASNMRQFYFNTAGNGTDIPSGSHADFSINPDEHITMHSYSSGGQTGFFALEPAVSGWGISDGVTTASILLNPTKIITDQQIYNFATNEEIFMDFVNSDSAPGDAHFKISNTADDRQQLTLDQNDYHARLKDDGVGFEYDGDSRNSWLGFGGLEMYSADAYDITLDQNNGFSIMNATAGETAGMNSGELAFTTGAGRFSKISSGSLGLSIVSPLSSFEVQDYLGGSGWLRFNTNGDGTEYPTDAVIGLDSNVETGWQMTHSSGTDAAIMQLNTSAVAFGHSTGSGSANFALNTAGIGLNTNGGQYFYLQSNPDADDEYLAVGPRTSGALLTTGGTNGGEVFGDIELGELVAIKRITGDIEKRFWFTDDGLIQMRAHNIASNSSGSVEVGDGSAYMFASDGTETASIGLNSSGTTFVKPINLFDVTASGVGTISFDDNTLIVKDVLGNGIFNASATAFGVPSATGVFGVLDFSAIASGDKAFNMINKSGKVPVIGTTAPSSATDTGVQGEIRVTSTFVYFCIATNTWVRGGMATW